MPTPPAARLIDLGPNVPMPTDEAAPLTQTLRKLAADDRLCGELLLYQLEGGRRLHRAVLRPGDTIFAEALSYPGIVALARQLRLNLVGIGIDDEGFGPAVLELACGLLAPHALSCVPTLWRCTEALIDGRHGTTTSLGKPT